ncbi:MAG: DUF805 domain-containing protein [Tahibacter sp.]
MPAPALNFLLPAGRLRRRTYVASTAVVALLGIAAWAALETWVSYRATWFVHLPLLWLLFALACRRLHDRDHSALRLLLLLIPLLGPAWIAVELVLLRGSRGQNRYGADPRRRRAGYPPISG